jgi:hypothetical protein
MGAVGIVGCGFFVAGSTYRSGKSAGKKSRLMQDRQRAHNNERRAGLEEGIAGIGCGVEAIQA